MESKLSSELKDELLKYGLHIKPIFRDNKFKYIIYGLKNGVENTIFTAKSIKDIENQFQEKIKQEELIMESTFNSKDVFINKLFNFLKNSTFINDFNFENDEINTIDQFENRFGHNVNEDAEFTTMTITLDTGINFVFYNTPEPDKFKIGVYNYDFLSKRRYKLFYSDTPITSEEFNKILILLKDRHFSVDNPIESLEDQLYLTSDDETPLNEIEEII